MAPSGKHFISDPKTLVRNSLTGLAMANPHLAFDEQQKVTFTKDLADLRQQQVTLFCGGGSGHEPAHAGFVGHGALTAAEHGTLVVIKNYTGDVLNFGRAIERFKSERVNHGKPLPNVTTVVVDDDVGVVNPNDDSEGGVGRRGLAGTVLAYKLAGAQAAAGGSLEQVKNIADYAVSHSFTIGCALNAASVPGQGMPRSLKDNEVEIGMGIHNEPGFETKELQAADILIPSLVKHIVSSEPFKKACPVVETPAITLLVLPKDESHYNNLLALVDQPAYCPAGSTTRHDESAQGPSVEFEPASDPTWERVIAEAYNNVVVEEPYVTLLDQLMGDGDCGQVLLSGATAIHEASEAKELPLNDPAAALARISSLIEDAMGGTSGIIYCLFLDGLAQQLCALEIKDNGSLSAKVWGKAMLGALDTLYQYTTARPGHRTLIDALQPFASTLSETGSRSTAHMQPKRGRAVYVQSKDSTADAGAAGLVAVLKGVVSALK
ncbi:hypothetical protein BX661DRAFT_183043 [Kickxella alabastrina]|uniref:uncharacterized protein n=1 Tax=Kickxella alabastrina TaxID=61397 RepID=UPI0022203771|nr:uncharacterized protein BX661DRAFT_183043 [Kickxella alabastrina]KAI7827320.1 hypothetical protein BX661DRAFT_183043 [Kickxella alabastrina]